MAHDMSGAATAVMIAMMVVMMAAMGLHDRPQDRLGDLGPGRVIGSA